MFHTHNSKNAERIRNTVLTSQKAKRSIPHLIMFQYLVYTNLEKFKYLKMNKGIDYMKKRFQLSKLSLTYRNKTYNELLST